MIVVSGGTGTLGRPTVELLRRAGAEVSVLSRRSGSGRLVADLSTGVGVEEALFGASTVVHLATTRGRGDAVATRTIVDAAKRTGVAHFVFISIVGIDNIPLDYYRQKLASERLVRESGMPYTILRATQFHDLVASVFRAQRWSPVLAAPSVVLQPVAAANVAQRLSELVLAGPAGDVPDMGGPEVLTGHALAVAWKGTTRSRRPVVRVRLPGAVSRALSSGEATRPDRATRGQTFSEFLLERFG